VEDVALTSHSQVRKLGLILEQLDKRLGLQDSSRIKWNVKRESRGSKATRGQHLPIWQRLRWDLVRWLQGATFDSIPTVRDSGGDEHGGVIF